MNATRPVRLVLFDIDGTILRSNGAGRRAMVAALREIFGVAGPEDHRYDGKTDPQIVREVMRIEGHEDAHIDERMDALMVLYLSRLQRELEQAHTLVHPGIVELLAALEARHDTILGLLTGNLREGAYAKLRAAGIDPERFRVGAFGSDHEHRPELPAVAQRRAQAELGIDLQGEHLVIIGDTPADIECGRSLGVRAIGVATGSYSVDELRSYGAHAVFETLADTDRVVSAIIDA
ncbi:MAG TPA: haloacid dehalogenase-like hydrolase [Gemmatimonadaceae bacterium]|jgi:phosphoglycolate phosphatase-like HAD superfamily hydrolase